jgi:hypothetical protein
MHLIPLIPNKKIKFICSFIKLSRRITLEVSFSQEKYLFATQTNCLTAIRLEKLTRQNQLRPTASWFYRANFSCLIAKQYVFVVCFIIMMCILLGV